ncbi:MAG: hypothetical protein FJW20_26385, partial [Acidimicrobiia bacterium]|nr:hypothetical protein [Acidimicrobiia bacterium]
MIAAEYFNKLSSERGLGLLAIARGTEPDPQFSPAATQGLRADGLIVAARKPQRIDTADVEGAKRVVTSFLMVLALAAMYLRLGGLPWMQGMSDVNALIEEAFEGGFDAVAEERGVERKRSRPEASLQSFCASC